MLAQQVDGELRADLHRRPLGGRHARDPRGLRSARPARAGARQPRAAHPERPQRRPRRGPRRVRRAHGRPHALSAGLPGARDRAPAPGRGGARERPSDRHRVRALVGPRRAGALHQARHRRRRLPSRDGRRDRRRQRVHGRLAAHDARAAGRLGRGLAPEPGRRAGRPHPRRRGAHRLHPRDGRELRPARRPALAGAPVLALRPLSRQDEPPPPGEHAPLPRAPAGGDAAAWC